MLTGGKSLGGFSWNSVFESFTTVCRHTTNYARVCRVYVSKLVFPTISSGVPNIHEYYRSLLLPIIIKLRCLPPEFVPRCW